MKKELQDNPKEQISLFLQTLEKNKQEDKDFILNKEPHLIINWLASLTDLEQKIVAVLYQLNQAVTIKTIRNTFIENSSCLPSLKKDFTDYIVYNFPFQTYYYLSPEKIIKEYEKSGKQEGELKTIKILKAFPSFRRIDNAIQDLISLKIIFERKSSELENKKIKGLYFLNPLIRNQLDKIKNKKIEDYRNKTKQERERIDNINKEFIKSGSKILTNY